MRKRTLLVVVAAVPVLVLGLLAGLATANGGISDQLRDVERATRQYRDVTVAQAAGYGELKDADGIACIDLPGVGGMGVHYVNGALVGDTVLDPQQPESLVYAPARDGRLKLVAVEYIVFADAWDAEHADPPSLFGAEFPLTPADNRFGIPAFYALHAWIYRPNPLGTFAPWNPRVTCPT
jgi:hypothetical protein